MYTGKRILIVDDSKPMTAFITDILKKANYEEVDRVYDGAYALRLLRDREYDLVITDSQMLPLSGLELTRLIKADARLRKVRIILIGSHGAEHAASLDGPDGYIIKPYKPADLMEKVQDALSTISQLSPAEAND